MASNDTPVTMPMEELPTDYNDYEYKNYRRRTPPRPVMCTVDFDSRRVSLGNGISSSEIVAYEIRNSDGETICLLSDEQSFVTTLSSLPSGEYRIILTLPSSSLSGYIYLCN